MIAGLEEGLRIGYLPAMGEHHCHFHLHDRRDEEPRWARELKANIHIVLHLLERIIEMSGSLGDQLNAGFVSLGTVLDTIQADVSTVSDEVNALVAGLKPGDTVTQAMVDQATALANRATAIDTALKAVAAAGATTSGGTVTSGGTIVSDGTSTP